MKVVHFEPFLTVYSNKSERRYGTVFFGEYSHNLDSKKRIILPSKLRERLGKDAVMTKSVDKCVALYPVERWEQFTAKLDSLPDIETRQVKRFLYSAAFETSVDSQGRILIAPNLCEYAELDRSVRIIGVGDHIEIWDENLWNGENSSENTADIANVLIKLGF